MYDKNLYAYCDNNPVVREDIDGMLWQRIAIGAAINVFSTIVSAIAVGDELTFMDIVMAAGIGAISSVEKYGVFLGAGLNFACTVYESYNNGETFKSAFSKGIVSATASMISFSDMAKLGKDTFSVVAENACNLTFGTGFGLVETVVNKSIYNRNSRKMSQVITNYPTTVRKRPLNYVSVSIPTVTRRVPSGYRNVLQK